MSNTPTDLEPRAAERKVAMVTGAGRRVGAAIALALGRAGWDVALHYRGSEEGAKKIAEEIRTFGGQAALIQADLSESEGCSSAIDQTLAAFGQLDLLVSSAANFEAMPFEEVDAAAFERAMNLNVRAPLLLAHRARAALAARRGSMVIITCTSATLPYPGFLPYVVSKGAAKQLMRTLALELAPHVRVNAVAPGTVLAPADYDEAQLSALAHKTLVRRLGRAEDIAEAVLYLASASFVTGHEILVDGGVALAGQHSGQ